MAWETEETAAFENWERINFRYELNDPQAKQIE